MYSALKAEVEIAEDPETCLNAGMIARLGSKERVLVCGQAQSHCVNFTVRDLVAHWPQEDLHRIVVRASCEHQTVSPSVPLSQRRFIHFQQTSQCRS